MCLICIVSLILLLLLYHVLLLNNQRSFIIIQQMSLLNKSMMTIAKHCSALFPATAEPYLLFIVSLLVYMNNTDNTDLLWCATVRPRHQLPIGSDFVNSSTSVRNLRIYIDADLSMRCHVQKTVASCFAVLHQLRSIRRSVPTSVYQTLVVALVLSRLDYGNAVLVGLPGYLYSRLQSVLNAAARSIAGL